jgi:hypothetical protein
MAVKQEVVITKETENLTLPLRRSLGKMELYFAKGGIGEGDLYIGRGVYLYNIPTKGYLFPQDAPALESSEIAHRESDKGDTSPYQKNGLPILRCGFEDTPSNPDEIAQLHINKITRRWNNKAPDDNTDGKKEYQWLPGKAVYLFANPYKSDKNAASGVEGDGYYMKILHHSHENSDTGADKEESHMDYVALPAVKPNMFVKVFLVIPLDGYTATRTWWKVGDWTEVENPGISFD